MPEDLTYIHSKEAMQAELEAYKNKASTSEKKRLAAQRDLTDAPADAPDGNGTALPNGTSPQDQSTSGV